MMGRVYGLVEPEQRIRQQQPMGLDIYMYVEVRRKGLWAYTPPDPRHMLKYDRFPANWPQGRPIQFHEGRDGLLYGILQSPPSALLAQLSVVETVLTRQALPADVSPELSSIGASMA